MGPENVALNGNGRTVSGARLTGQIFSIGIFWLIF